MTTFLDLDKLEPTSNRSLTIKGVSYPVEPMSVENFVVTTRTIQRLTANEATTLADQMEATVDMICRSVPSVPRDVLLKYSLETLNNIASFVRGEDVEGQQSAVADEAGK